MSALPLLARLGEAATFPKAVRNYESDPWGYLRRKLEHCEFPLRDYKQELLDDAMGRLLVDLKAPLLQPGALIEHKETFEKLLAPAEFADLVFHLAPGDEPAARREKVKAILAAARLKTAFDVEKLPPEQRGKPWQSLVEEMGRRLELDALRALYERGERNDHRRAYIVRRARRNLGEYLSVTRGEVGMRDDITLFVLTRVEAVMAAMLRFLRAP